MAILCRKENISILGRIEEETWDDANNIEEFY
jgi:hypothetical protein